MQTFYPGPSKIYPEIEKYLQDAFKSGILQMNHRSQPFMDLLRETIDLLHEKLNIPENYTIYFTSSATECWEIISQSLVEKNSFHVFNGAFGKKWFEYAKKIQLSIINYQLSINQVVDYQHLTIPDDAEIVCFTQNETSNGTKLNLDFGLQIAEFQHSELIAFDVTSSMAGIELNWQSGDVWLASVQKCFGLPAGMGILICSPKALKRAEKIGERNHYNSLLFIQENFKHYQTHYTPNVLGIYLLKRIMMQVPDIQVVSSKIKARAKDFYEFIENETSWKLLVENPEVRSDTVIAIEGSAEEISAIKLKATQHEITLGNGYGDWKNTTFRIANFPAIEDWEFEKLKKLLKK